MKYTTYEVTLRFKFPAWDEKNGIPYTIEATSKKEAIKRARSQAADDGHLVARPITEYSFSAVEVTEESQS
jgi:hypothetical protein